VAQLGTSAIDPDQTARCRQRPKLAPEETVDACYYSIIERAEDGHFHGWVPDLAGVTADGCTEKEAVERLFREARACVRDLILTGAPIPQPRPAEELPGGAADRTVRRLLLVIT
jgi:predicted RNase H-like HicB family nuclease